jgi:uncharacterized protein
LKRKPLHKKKVFTPRKSYVPKTVVRLLFLSIIVLVFYILYKTNINKRNMLLEEPTPALDIVYTSSNYEKTKKEKTQEKISKMDIKTEYEKITKNNLVLEEQKNNIIQEDIKYKYIRPPQPPIETKLQKEKVENFKNEKKEVVKKDTKPKLAIVCDDVSFKNQVKTILDIGYPITMAFLPPTLRHKDSANIAQNIPFHIIHFPLEAKRSKYAEEKTLKIDDSYEKMLQRVQELHILYPKATYTNNHTGSKFTANKKAMNNLMKALKKYNFTFLDSRTTAKSVAREAAKKYKVPFLSRNIFLDNKQDKSYIQKKLKEAVAIARKYGSAIAICHPRKVTLKTLKESKHLLSSVQLVLINKL